MLGTTLPTTRSKPNSSTDVSRRGMKTNRITVRIGLDNNGPRQLVKAEEGDTSVGETLRNLTITNSVKGVNHLGIKLTLVRHNHRCKHHNRCHRVKVKQRIEH